MEAWGVEDDDAVALLRQALDGLYKHFDNTHEEAMVSVISFMVLFLYRKEKIDAEATKLFQEILGRMEDLPDHGK